MGVCVREREGVCGCVRVCVCVLVSVCRHKHCVRIQLSGWALVAPSWFVLQVPDV